MPSFDTVSEIDMHELTNAVDQVNRELSTRYDFKGSDAKLEQSETTLTLHAESKFQVEQINTIVREKFAKREIDVNALEFGVIEEANLRARQTLTVRQGIDKEMAKKLTKIIKESKIKVQAAIQGEQVRVTGKKRDDLQQAIAALKGANVGIPLQFVNFRD